MTLKTCAIVSKQKEKERKEKNLREENGERKWRKKESGGDPGARCCARVGQLGSWWMVGLVLCLCSGSWWMVGASEASSVGLKSTNRVVGPSISPPSEDPKNRTPSIGAVVGPDGGTFPWQQKITDIGI